MNPTRQTLRVAILAFDDVEALDLAGPYEVFTTASRMQQRATSAEPPLFEVTCVARSREPIRMRAGLCVLPRHTVEDAPNPDVLIVPGGVVDVATECAATRAAS